MEKSLNLLLYELSSYNEVVLYGAGRYGQVLAKVLNDFSIKLIMAVSTYEKLEKNESNVQILSDVIRKYPDAIYVLSVGPRMQDTMLPILAISGAKHIRILAPQEWLDIFSAYNDKDKMQCLVCGRKISRYPYSEYTYRTARFKALFPLLGVYYCPECGLYQCNIVHDDENEHLLFEYYKSEYRAGDILPDFTNRQSKYWVRAKGIANIITKYISTEKIGRIFEKGAGLGFNLMMLKEKYPEAEIMTDEMDEHTHVHLRKIGVCKYDNNPVDIIICSQVLEHLTNPVETLRYFYNHLTIGGLLYIEVPNDYNFAEPHISYWSPESLRKFYEKYGKGFKVLEFFTCDLPTYWYGEKREIEKLRNRATVLGIEAMNEPMPNGSCIKSLLKKEG